MLLFLLLVSQSWLVEGWVCFSEETNQHRKYTQAFHNGNVGFYNFVNFYSFGFIQKLGQRRLPRGSVSNRTTQRFDTIRKALKLPRGPFWIYFFNKNPFPFFFQCCEVFPFVHYRMAIISGGATAPLPCPFSLSEQESLWRKLPWCTASCGTNRPTRINCEPLPQASNIFPFSSSRCMACQKYPTRWKVNCFWGFQNKFSTKAWFWTQILHVMPRCFCQTQHAENRLLLYSSETTINPFSVGIMLAHARTWTDFLTCFGKLYSFCYFLHLRLLVHRGLRFSRKKLFWWVCRMFFSWWLPPSLFPMEIHAQYWGAQLTCHFWQQMGLMQLGIAICHSVFLHTQVCWDLGLSFWLQVEVVMFKFLFWFHPGYWSQRVSLSSLEGDLECEYCCVLNKITFWWLVHCGSVCFPVSEGYSGDSCAPIHKLVALNKNKVARFHSGREQCCQNW